MKTYRRTTTIQAKLFELGDQDGFTSVDGSTEWHKEYALQNLSNSNVIPYIRNTDQKRIKGLFGKNYLCVDIQGNKSIIEKGLFEITYTLHE